MKRFAALLSALALLACWSLTAYAAADEDAVPYICDTVPLLADDEWLELEAQAETIAETYQCAVYFITVEDYTDYGSGDIYGTAKDIYLANDLGYGTEKSGVMLLLSMADRDYTLIAYGYGNTAFTDYGKDYLSERFLDNFAGDDWYGGCKDYLSTCDEMLSMARSGQPLDLGSRIHPIFPVLVSLILGFLLALIICGSLSTAASKKTSVKTMADDYLKSGGMQITHRSDKYAYTTQNRRKIEKSSSSSGGTSIDQEGFSGKSGKF